AFIGKSLFRATIELPANVTVGPFETRVYLFREEKLLSQYTVRLNLEREGLERHLHRFAFGYPTLYGLMTVAIALAAGLIASTVFRRAAHGGVAIVQQAHPSGGSASPRTPPSCDTGKRKRRPAVTPEGQRNQHLDQSLSKGR